jgi:RNA polymerase sigma-70 factor (ECF subfamily)
MPGNLHSIQNEPNGRPPTTNSAEAQLVAALRRGDESAFCAVVDRYHRSLVRLARTYVSDPMVAEEIVQETWLALVRGIGRFEARSSLKTWLFHVLSYQANRRMKREARTIPFSELHGPTVDPERFDPSGTQWAGHWSEELPDWEGTPEERLLTAETLACIDGLIARLPERQRQVIILRDIEGLSAADACSVLEIPDRIQRLLLHRARARVREGLTAYVLGDEGVSA